MVSRGQKAFLMQKNLENVLFLDNDHILTKEFK